MLIRAPSVVSVLAQFAVAKLSLFTLGFGPTLARYERTPRSAVANVPPDDPLVAEVAHRIAVAAALYPGRARCLEQSLVLSRALRQRGADATLRFGVHPYPFTAHAWVEVQGCAINEMEGYLDMFTPLED
jgi:Transglutaminase-like superfamily